MVRDLKSFIGKFLAVLFLCLTLLAPVSGLFTFPALATPSSFNAGRNDIISNNLVSNRVYKEQNSVFAKIHMIGRKPLYVPDEILVKVKEGKSLGHVMSGLDGKLVKEDKKSRVQKIKLSKGVNLLSAVEAYRTNPNVEYVEPNYIRKPSYIPNDPDLYKQWGIDKTRVKEAWNISKGDSSTIIAIIDTGIDFNHPDLAAKIVYPYDSVTDSTNILQVKDYQGHGTHVAGIAAATIDNNIGIAGIAGNVKIMPVKAYNDEYGGFSDMDIADAIYWAVDHGARVINLSLGGYGYSFTLQNAVNYALNKNVVVVAAAGNDSTDIPTYPAAYEGVIGVAATDEYDSDAVFSNFGSYIDISAPGTNIYSTVPTYYVSGFSINYDYSHGTSMASPAVAGLAGLILSVNPSLNRVQVESYICQNAQDINVTGTEAGWDPYTGWGRINAYKTLLAVLSPKGYLDSPKEGQTLSGTVNVIGWFLDGSGVSKIEILVDGVVKGQAVYGDTRLDVGRVFPAYNNNNSGFHYSLDTTKLSNGTHTVTIRETGANGSQTILPARTVTVLNSLPAKGYLDSPKEGQTLSGTVNVIGWFLDGSGVSKIEILVDGVVKGQAVYGDTRLDVGRVLPAYNNNNSGFHYSLDTTKLSNGTHTVTIRETGANGSQTILPARTVTVLNSLPAKGYLDSPKEGQTLSGTVNVIGWFLDGDGVSKIEVIVDGIIQGQAYYGVNREDVYNVLPAYDNHNSGYSYSLDTTQLTNGSHQITIRETSLLGKETNLPSRSVVVIN
ncbi:peptidase S8 and S53 subtilisin kexin sedolisin [Thermincola ferriacetica]|uniref:Peptidase S8 and S53 subtilisin kexin sedolisin n=1 Tax=Thermincola ferriacetica TaxID=281456 RepID=A0A0L6W3J7_9FIRM|nr:S8 family serine peptidase [Thermincola ferriacetica]KNZ70036.1 peptidase S8 and S53 subtilisin kexin sedolisin [Thermincola ferriacetica]